MHLGVGVGAVVWGGYLGFRGERVEVCGGGGGTDRGGGGQRGVQLMYFKDITAFPFI